MKRLSLLIILFASSLSHGAIQTYESVGGQPCSAYIDGNEADHREIARFLTGYLHGALGHTPDKKYLSRFIRKVYSLCDTMSNVSIIDSAKSVWILEDFEK